MSETYTTKQGDTWDSIAFTQLGSEGYMDKLMLCNPKYIHHVVFPAGIELVLPTITKTEKDRSNLPPWKR